MGMRDSRQTYNAYLRKYMARRYEERMSMALSYLGGRCRRCESQVDLEIDHIDPGTKYRNVSELTTLSLSRFLDELEKCQILCKDCHIQKTLEDRGQASARGTHGTLSALRYCGPPACQECRAAHRRWEYNRKAHAPL